MALAIGIIIIIATLAFIVWAVAKMVVMDCPSCAADNASGTIVPVIPFKLWACINCGSTCSTSELVERDSERQPRIISDSKERLAAEEKYDEEKPPSF